MVKRRRLTRIANDNLEKFRLNFSRCTNRDIALLNCLQWIIGEISTTQCEKEETCDGLVSHPGGVATLLVASC